ncbi:hypothetical protein [Tabrizicola sp.]|uniref:hypothetical protein n=1 Tax=Tabrizicola sp. TaxID=2005166 RepID=UPI00286B253D|nr:hypothetical protein [Tabrizicola sp.]
MWVDPNLNDFYNRVSRIEKSHAKGYGFEASGTISRAGSATGKGRSWSFVKPLVITLLLGVSLKGMIHYYIGADVYQNRVDALVLGQGFDPVGGWLMQADPATAWISNQLQVYFPR